MPDSTVHLTALELSVSAMDKEIGIYDEAGSISAGKRADFVLLNDDLDIVSVYIDGKEISC